MPCLGRFCKPVQGPAHVRLHSLAQVVEHTKIVHGLAVASLGMFAPDAFCRGIVAPGIGHGGFLGLGGRRGFLLYGRGDPYLRHFIRWRGFFLRFFFLLALA